MRIPSLGERRISVLLGLCAGVFGAACQSVVDFGSFDFTAVDAGVGTLMETAGAGGEAGAGGAAPAGAGQGGLPEAGAGGLPPEGQPPAVGGVGGTMPPGDEVGGADPEPEQDAGVREPPPPPPAVVVEDAAVLVARGVTIEAPAGWLLARIESPLVTAIAPQQVTSDGGATVTLRGDGSFVYEPAGGAALPSVDAFPFDVIVNGESQEGARVVVSFFEAVDDRLVLRRAAGPHAVDPVQNDVGLGASVQLQGGGATQRGGSVEGAEGALRYTPPSQGFWGDDRFDYALQGDGVEALGRSAATVELTVEPDFLMANELSAVGAPAYALFGFGGMNLGFSVASAGVILPGRSDFIVGAFLNSRGASNQGMGYVGFGGPALATRSAIDLEFPGSGEGFAVEGAGTSDFLGATVASAGDFDGDGFGDVVLGAPAFGTARPGSVYLVRGGPAVTGILDLAAPPASAFFEFEGGVVGGQAGFGLGFAGDVNNDGFGDIIIGEPGAQDDPADAGRAYVVFGSASPRSLNLAAMTEGDGFVIRGAGALNQVGLAVSGAGDFNGDGLSDVIVNAAPRSDADATGTVYVVYGKRDGTPVDVDALAGRGIALTEGQFNRGSSVASAGDVNGDGFDDVVVGSPAGPGNGRVRVVFGSAQPASLSMASIDAQQGGGFSIGGSPETNLGQSVFGAGDFNGDGLDDVIAGAPGADEGGDGSAFLVLGRRDASFGQVNLATLSQFDSAGLVVNGVPGDGARLGFAVSGAGDLNADGLSDLLIGAPTGDGTAYVVLGWRRNRAAANSSL